MANCGHSHLFFVELHLQVVKPSYNLYQLSASWLFHVTLSVLTAWDGPSAPKIAIWPGSTVALRQTKAISVSLSIKVCRQWAQTERDIYIILFLKMSKKKSRIWWNLIDTGTSQQKAMPTSRACSADLTFIRTAGSFPCFGAICEAYKPSQHEMQTLYLLYLKICPTVQMYFPPPADAIDHATDGFPLLPDQCSVHLHPSTAAGKKLSVWQWSFTVLCSSLCSFFLAK